MKPIWIVDDDPSIRFVLEKALAREQLPVRSFANTRDVLAALETDEPQVLVDLLVVIGVEPMNPWTLIAVQVWSEALVTVPRTMMGPWAGT